jgi:hypothetical protein
MRTLRVIGISLIVCVVLLIAAYFLKEGFADSTDPEDSMNDHEKYVNDRLKNYNSVGIALIGSNTVGNLGNSTRDLMGSPDEKNVHIPNGMKGIYPLQSKVSGLFNIIQTCEAIKTVDCNAFDDPKFSLNCGMCLDIGTDDSPAMNSDNKPAVGGRVLLPDDKQTINEESVGNFLPPYVPTIGTCPAGRMVSTKAQCIKLKREMACEKGANYDLTNCVQCFDSGGYAIVDPTQSPNLLNGSGVLNLFGVGILNYSETGYETRNGLILSQSQPLKIALEGREMTRILLSVTNPDDKDGNPPSLSGYLSGITQNGEFTLDLYRMVLNDAVTGRKPLTGGTKVSNGVDTVTMIAGFGNKQLVVYANSPVTFVDPMTQEGATCPTSPYVTTPAAASLLATDPCYKQGSGPGKYSLECLQNTFISNGCIDDGKGYPKDATSASNLLMDPSGKTRSLNDIANYIYALAIISATGVDQNGTEQTLEKWSTASVFCSGKKILTPCDTAARDTGPLSADCLVYLWDNMGSSSSVGSTYNKMSQGTSLFSRGSNPRFCQRTGTLSPRGPDGKDRADVMAYWKSQGGLRAVKTMMMAVNDAANDSSQYTSDEDRGPYITQCFGDIKLAPRPPPLNTQTPPPSCPTAGCGTLARYVRYFNNPSGWLYVSQITVFDIYGNNIALNCKVMGQPVGWPGPLAVATNGDTTIGNNMTRNWHAQATWIEIDLGKVYDVMSVYLYQNPGWAFGWQPSCDAKGGRIELGTTSYAAQTPYNSGVVYNPGDICNINGTTYRMVEGAGRPGFSPLREGDKLWKALPPEVGTMITATKPITTTSKDQPIRFFNFENPNPDPKCLQCMSNCPYPKGSDIQGLCGKTNAPVISRLTDNGYTSSGGFATHFPTSNQIILDSRGTDPDIGSVVTGPFIQPGTKLTALSNYGRMPSNPYVDGTLATLSKPLVNIGEKKGDVFTYKFKSGWS